MLEKIFNKLEKFKDYGYRWSLSYEDGTYRIYVSEKDEYHSRIFTGVGSTLEEAWNNYLLYFKPILQQFEED